MVRYNYLTNINIIKYSLEADIMFISLIYASNFDSSLYTEDSTIHLLVEPLFQHIQNDTIHMDTRKVNKCHK